MSSFEQSIWVFPTNLRKILSSIIGSLASLSLWFGSISEETGLHPIFLVSINKLVMTGLHPIFLVSISKLVMDFWYNMKMSYNENITSILKMYFKFSNSFFSNFFANLCFDSCFSLSSFLVSIMSSTWKYRSVPPIIESSIKSVVALTTVNSLNHALGDCFDP